MLDDLISTVLLTYLCIFVSFTIGAYLLPVGDSINKWLGMTLYAMTLPVPYSKVFFYNIGFLSVSYYFQFTQTFSMFVWILLLSAVSQLINRTDLIEDRRFRILNAVVKGQSE